MNKRTFIKLTSALMATPVIAPLASWMSAGKIKNWAGNITYSTDNLYDATSINELKNIITKYDRIKVLGTRHCFNEIADSKDNFVSLLPLHDIISINENNTVTLQAGMKYGELAPLIEEKGLALHNLASLPHISVAGACITGTHGSGVHNKNLSASVVAFEFVDAQGKLHIISKEKDAEQLNALVVNLGAIGAVTSITLKTEPTYKVRQYVFEHLSFNAMKENFENIIAAGYSVSLFTDWVKDINEVWIKQKVDGNMLAIKDFYDATAATKNMHPIAEISAENCTEQMGVPGVWYERLPHFKMGFTPSSGKELQTEYFVPHEHAVEAILAIKKLGDKISPHLFISEIRTIDADELWMSPCYNQACVAIHFTWKQEWEAVKQLLPEIEKTLSPYNIKPHWGKIFTITGAELRRKYKQMNAFIDLARSYDAKGKFRNDFLNRNIFI